MPKKPSFEEIIEMKLIDIRIEMEKLEHNDTKAFMSEKWKVLQSQREILGEVLKEAVG